MNFNTNDLRLFISSAEYGSFTKAAAVNNTVQSNVSARIKYLEEMLKVKLFSRSTRSVELTEEGVLFLKLAREIILSISNFSLAINKNGSPVKKLIRIGCIQTTAALRAPEILQRFSSDYPNVEFQLKTGTTEQLIKEVLSFKLDGAFVTSDLSHPDIEVQPVIKEKLCIVSSSLYPSIHKLRKISGAVKLIVFNKGCSYRKKLNEILSEMNFDTFKYVEMDTLEGIINSVEEGIGITLLPVELIERYYSYRNIQMISLPEHFSDVPTVFIKRKDFPKDNDYSLFLESIAKGYR